MSQSSLSRRAFLIAALLFGAAPAVAATFNFDGLAPTNGATPFSITAGGVSAQFTSPAGPGAFIAEDGSAFSTLGASVLANDNFVPEELDIGFGRNVASILFNFATNDAGAPTALTLTATRSGAAVGSVTVTGSVAASGLPEGALSFAGVFDAVRITDADASNAGFAIGAVDIQVPEPPTLLVVSAGLAALAGLRRRG